MNENVTNITAEILDIITNGINLSDCISVMRSKSIFVISNAPKIQPLYKFSFVALMFKDYGTQALHFFSIVLV